jgi:hypothetical protein
MAIPQPRPVAVQPNVTGNGGDADDLFARGWRGDHDDAARIMPLVRNDHAAGENYGHDETGSPRTVRRHENNRE